MAGNPDDDVPAEPDDEDVSRLLATLREAFAPTHGTDAKRTLELQRLFSLDKCRSNSRNFNVHCRTTKEGRTVRPLCAAVIYCFNQRQLNPLAPLPNPGVAVAVAVDVVHGDTFSGVGADVPKAAKAKLFKHDQRTLLNSYTSFISIMINNPYVHTQDDQTQQHRVPPGLWPHVRPTGRDRPKSTLVRHTLPEPRVV